MLVTLLIRIAVTLTFLILAAGGPYAIIKLRNFIRRYALAHAELKQDLKTEQDARKALESRVLALEHRTTEGQQ